MTVISMALHGKTIAACPLHNRRVEVWALCTIPEINGPLLGGWLTPLQTHPGGYHKGCLLVWQVDTAAPCHALIIGARRRPAEALLQLVRRQTTPSGVQIRKERKKERKKRRTEEGGWCISAARACFMWRGEKIGRRQRSMEKSWEERKGQKKRHEFWVLCYCKFRTWMYEKKSVFHSFRCRWLDRHILPKELFRTSVFLRPWKRTPTGPLHASTVRLLFLYDRWSKGSIPFTTFTPTARFFNAS